MASVVPTSCMVVVVVIIMCFVAARQCHGGYAYEEERAECVPDLIFHGGCLCLDIHKPCQLIKVCCTGVLRVNMAENVDISPQTEKCHQSGIV
jgi:hypothetical protein